MKTGRHWTIFFISCAIAIFAIPATTLSDVAQPATFFMLNTVMLGILYLRPQTSKA